jgi:hypothetical protein
MTSPKEELLRDESACREIRNLVDSKTMVRALNAAFGQFCFDLPAGENPQKSWDANNRRAGALEFIRVLTTIADTKAPPRQRESDYLTPPNLPVPKSNLEPT